MLSAKKIQVNYELGLIRLDTGEEAADAEFSNLLSQKALLGFGTFSLSFGLD